MAKSNLFAHRRNRDGSFDSICPHCFMTAASGLSEHELEGHERVHQCFGDFSTRNEESEKEMVH